MSTNIEVMPQSMVGQLDDEAVAHQRKFEEISLTHLISGEYASLVSTVLAPAVPKQILLGSLRDGRLRVKAPIVVNCAREDENIVAEAVEINEFGFGKNVSEAVTDLQRAVVELYMTLESEQGRIGPDLQNVWEKMQEKVTRVK